MDESALPDLAEIQRRLAADNIRVDAAVDCMFQGVQRLIEASLSDDWREVERIARHLAHTSLVTGQHDIAIQAKQLCEMVADGSANADTLRDGVRRLIADYHLES